MRKSPGRTHARSDGGGGTDLYKVEAVLHTVRERDKGPKEVKKRAAHNETKRIAEEMEIRGELLGGSERALLLFSEIVSRVKNGNGEMQWCVGFAF